MLSMEIEAAIQAVILGVCVIAGWLLYGSIKKDERESIE